MAGQAQVEESEEAYERARSFFEAHKDDFVWTGGAATDYWTLWELAKAARAVGREDEARRLYERAKESGLRQDW
jgi:hypothetical protein